MQSRPTETTHAGVSAAHSSRCEGAKTLLAPNNTRGIPVVSCITAGGGEEVWHILYSETLQYEHLNSTVLLQHRVQTRIRYVMWFTAMLLRQMIIFFCLLWKALYIYAPLYFILSSNDFWTCLGCSCDICYTIILFISEEHTITLFVLCSYSEYKNPYLLYNRILAPLINPSKVKVFGKFSNILCKDQSAVRIVWFSAAWNDIRLVLKMLIWLNISKFSKV